MRRNLPALVACRKQSLVPVHGEKVRMRGGASGYSGQPPKPLTPTLSPPRRGEGVLCNPEFEFNVFRGLRQNLRAVVGGRGGVQLAVNAVAGRVAGLDGAAVRTPASGRVLECGDKAADNPVATLAPAGAVIWRLLVRSRSQDEVGGERGPGARPARRNPGRGFNLFRGLRRNLRAIVTPKPFTLTRSRRA